MTDAWFFLASAEGPPARNMALDEALLEASRRLSRPVLRVYGWTIAAATFGYFQHYAEVAAMTELRPLIRRPTGGGLVPHAADWTYSVIVPPTHPWYGLSAVESYRTVHDWVRQAFVQVQIPTELAPAPQRVSPGQCFLGAERFDVLWNGMKVAGAAQRRNRLGLLIQGSVQPQSQRWPRSDWERALRTITPLGQMISWTELELDSALMDRVSELDAHKYSQRSYNERR